MAMSTDQEPTEDTRVVIVAVDEGDIYCLTDEDGEPQTYTPGDPAIAELVESAASTYGADVRAMLVSEFLALGEDTE
jgi:hypothetical protein